MCLDYAAEACRPALGHTGAGPAACAARGAIARGAWTADAISRDAVDSDVDGGAPWHAFCSAPCRALGLGLLLSPNPLLASGCW